MGCPVDCVVLEVAMYIQQAVVQKRVKVKVHLFGAQVGPGHDMGLFDSACSGGKDVVYDV